jgi:hypothetical protein
VLYACGSTDFGRQLTTGTRSVPDTMVLNALDEPAGVYLVTPRYDRIDRVALISKAAGSKGKETPLGNADWRFSAARDTLTLTKAIDGSQFGLRIWGTRIDPYTAVGTEEIVADSVKLAKDGRIGIRDKDYYLGKDGRSIVIPGYDGDRYWLKYKSGSLTISMGDWSRDNSTRSILKYFDWPLTPNFTPKAGKPGTFVCTGERFETIWRIQLIPIRDDDLGSLLDKPGDWTFDAGTQELSLAKAVAPSRFLIHAWGDASTKTPVYMLPANPLDSRNLAFKPMQVLNAVYGVEVRENLHFQDNVRILGHDEWVFDSQTQTLTLQEPVDPKIYCVLINGSQSLPVTFQNIRPIDPASVRFVYDGRKAVEGQDYVVDPKTGSLTILIPDYPKTTRPNILVYQLVGQAGAAASDQANEVGSSSNIGPGELYKLAPELIRYLGKTGGFLWEPVPGRPGAYHNPSADRLRFRILRTVELASVVDGQSGRLLSASDWSFDPKSQILTLAKPVPVSDFVLQAWGDS